MKSKYIFTFYTSIAIQILCNAQIKFPDETINQKWEYVVWNFWGGKCEKRILKQGKKIPLCNQNYIEVMDCNSTEKDCYIIGYYRVQNDSVLIRIGNSFIPVDCNKPEGLMYDFSAKTGDNLECVINSSYPPLMKNFFVTNTQSIQYESIFRNTQSIDYIPYPNSPEIKYKMKWMEGIGSNVHPFYSFSCIGDHCEQELQLTKVYRDNVLIFQDSIVKFFFPCTGWVGTKTDLEIKTYLTLVPNPTNSSFAIHSDLIIDKPNTVQIFDLSGKIMMKIDNYHFDDMIICTPSMKGLYIVQTINENKIDNFKLLIQD